MVDKSLRDMDAGDLVGDAGVDLEVLDGRLGRRVGEVAWDGPG